MGTRFLGYRPSAARRVDLTGMPPADSRPSDPSPWTVTRAFVFAGGLAAAIWGAILIILF